MTPGFRRWWYGIVLFAALGLCGAVITVAWIRPVESDWSQFLPDTVISLSTSILVGGFIGTVIFRMERGNARTVARVSALANWGPVKSKMVNSLFPQPLGAGGLGLLDFTGPLEKWVALWDAFPIEEWALAAPDQRDLVLVSDLRRELPRLVRESTDLRHAIEVAYEDLSKEPKKGGVTLDFGKPRTVTEQIILGLDVSASITTKQEKLHKKVMKHRALEMYLGPWRERLAKVNAIETELGSLVQ